LLSQFSSQKVACHYDREHQKIFWGQIAPQHLDRAPVELNAEIILPDGGREWPLLVLLPVRIQVWTLAKDTTKLPTDKDDPEV